MGTFMMNAGLFVFCCVLCIVQARNVLVSVPNTLRLDVEETIAIAATGDKETVSVFLKDFDRKNTFSHKNVEVESGHPKLIKVVVTHNDLPDINFSKSKENTYVFLVVTGHDFTNECKLLVSLHSGYTFIQTDKPIYTPHQTVNVWILPLNDQLLPKNEPIRLQIKNPQGIVAKQNIFEKPWETRFPTFTYNIPPHPKTGEWSVVAQYGHNFQLNSTVPFKVDKYVLPTFTVKIKVRNFILPGDSDIKIDAFAEYVYGKKVQGTAVFKFGVKDQLGNIIAFGSKTKILEDGEASIKFEMKKITDHYAIKGFPFESKLFVEANVMDTATGIHEKAISEESIFVNSPYIISFRRSLKDFKPGLVAVILADVVYANGKPAAEVPTSIEVVDCHGKPVDVSKPTYISDKNGHIRYDFETHLHSPNYTVMIKTKDMKYKENQQFEGRHVLVQYNSPDNSYVAITRIEGNKIYQVGERFSASVYSIPTGQISNVFYLVLSKGRILFVKHLSENYMVERQLSFDITPEMSPSIRIVMYALYKNELVTDSIHVEIKPVCQPNSEVEIESKFKERTPGSEGKIILHGKPGTSVGIFATDSAIYALRNKDRLTKDMLFQTLKNDDIGCGPGGGLNTLSVLSNAGVTIFGNFKNISNENNVPSCAERVRHKREIIDAMVNKHGIDDKKCCKLGTLPDKYNRLCEERAKIVQNITNENNDGNCAAAFLYCCKKLANSVPSCAERVRHKREIIDAMVDKLVKADVRRRAIGSDFDNLEPVEDIDQEEQHVSVRKDFRETWLFQDFEIGDNGKKEVFTNLPDSITTWVIQAVSVSKQSRMCVSDAKEIVSFKNIFLHLNIPYSVVQNEQVEIQATVFNYKSYKVTVTVYMYGVEDLCTGVDAGERSEYKEITIDPYSSATVGFPVVPLKIKEYIIRVVALSQAGHDVVEKKLRVVAKGVPFENNIPFVLDPTNLRNRKETDTITDTYTNFIDPSRNLQITTVTLKPNENRVHGTESCLISVVGNEIGPTVETILMAPENLVNKPLGSGEATMIFMGPTVYTLRYLKTKGKVTPEFERKIYDFIREGYNRELTFRKDDGSYSAFQNRPSSIWLTAFVMKIFCQSSNFIFIDRSVIRTGIKWLIEQQNDDGSFIERNPMIHLEMMGGNNGVIPMTAFVLISLQHCNTELKELQCSKLNAKVYLENAISIINEPYSMSLVSYALALSSSKLTDTANEILRNMSIYDEGPNQRYWSSGSSSYDIETTAYALLTQIAVTDMQYSLPIINWLNTKRLAGGRFDSLQDTVVALQALSRYAMVAQSSEIDLYCNITQSNSKKSTVMHFTNDNAEVVQELELEKVGGTVFFTTQGKGVGHLSVQLRYNVEQPPEKLCKFDITVNITEGKVDVKPAIVNKNIGKDFFEEIPVDLLRGLDIDDDHAEFQNDERINFDNIILNNADFGGINPQIKDKPNFMPHVPIQQMANEIGGEKGVDYIDRNRDINYNDKRNRDIDGDDRNRALDQDNRNRNIDFDYDNGVGDENEDERYRAIKGKVQKANSKAILQITICARYLSAKQTDMSIIDAGIFSGFKPEIDDLKKLVIDANGIVDRYKIAGRSVVFYLKHIPFDKPVCLKFRVIRQFIVGVVQPAVIKVFDYYNPEETCTRFYRPDSNSPFLRKICEGSICQCAEGGCPRAKPFKSIPQQINEARDSLLMEACEKHDYVWMGIVKSTQKKDNFFHISFKITKVLKTGAETEIDTEYTTKILLLQDSCTSFEFIDNQVYLIMGNDGEGFVDKQTKNLMYHYLVDRSTIIHKWTLIRKAENKKLQKILNWLKIELEPKGCQY